MRFVPGSFYIGGQLLIEPKADREAAVDEIGTVFASRRCSKTLPHLPDPLETGEKSGQQRLHRDPKGDDHRPEGFREVVRTPAEFVRIVERAGKACYVIESAPTGSAAYKRKLSWIDKAAFLPLREEYYDAQNQLFREFSAEEVREIDGIPTIMKRSVKNVKTGHRTLVEFSETKYELSLKPGDFTERALRNPPAGWTK